MLDVNVGTRVAAALTEAGHDVRRVALTDALAEDSEILVQAADGERILVTCDRDFSELLFVGGAAQPPGVIYLRFRARDVEAVIAHLLPALDIPAIAGHMTVIDERRVSSRAAPCKKLRQ